MSGVAARTVVGLRTADQRLVHEVRRLTELVGADLEVVAPGAPPPRATLLLDDGVGPVPWSSLPGEAPVVRVHGGAGSAGGDEVPAVPVGPGPELNLPEESETLLEMVATGHGRARVLGVLGAHGGAGASVLAAVLARAAVRAGAATALVDLDPVSGGLDLLLALEHDPGLRWPDLAEGAGAFLPRLSLSLPDWRGVRVLSGDARGGRSPDDQVVTPALAALAQSHDLLVLDLPRAVLAPADRPVPVAGLCQEVLVVTACDVRSAAAALTVSRLVQRRGLTGHLVVRRGPASPARATEVAEQCGLPLAAVLGEERSLRAGLERGIAPGDTRGPLLTAARRLLQHVAVPG